MKKTPMFSIVLPSRNGARLLPISMGSLAEQTDKDFEVVLVDDASEDGTLEVMQGLRNKIGALHGTKLIRRKESLGQCAAPFSDAFEASEGEFVFLFGDDDYYLPKHFEGMKKFLTANPHIDWAHEDVFVWNYATSRVNWVSTADYAGLPPGAMVADFIRGRFPFCGAVAFRRTLVKKLGGINASLNYCEDLDLWFRMLNNGSTLHKRWGEPTFVYRDRPLSQKPVKWENRARDMLKTIWSAHENANDPEVKELTRKYHDKVRQRTFIKRLIRNFKKID